MLSRAGFKRKKFDTTAVSFILAPRLNASGRMDKPDTSLQLLICRDGKTADELAAVLDNHNRQRQKIESRIMQEAEELINKEMNFKEQKVIVLAKENWHHGVLGIVASKLADRFWRPAVVISLDQTECKGSARSIKNFHLFDALRGCRDHLHAFGGHSHAAGLVIMRDSIDDFKRTINRLAHERLALQDLLPSIDVDLSLPLEVISGKMVEEMELLEPFGSGNSEPLFYTQGLKLKGEPRVMARETLKFWATDGTTTYQTLGFGMAGFKASLMHAESFDMVYRPRIDSWGGIDAVILEARDIFFR
jgi:single-stranded-DNA-specific exonuclease